MLCVFLLPLLSLETEQIRLQNPAKLAPFVVLINPHGHLYSGLPCTFSSLLLGYLSTNWLDSNG